MFFVDGDPYAFRFLAMYWAIGRIWRDELKGLTALLILSSDRLYYGVGAPGIWRAWVLFTSMRILKQKKRDLPTRLLVAMTVTSRSIVNWTNGRFTTCGVLRAAPWEGLFLALSLFTLSFANCSCMVLTIVAKIRPPTKRKRRSQVPRKSQVTRTKRPKLQCGEGARKRFFQFLGKSGDRLNSSEWSSIATRDGRSAFVLDAN